MRWMGRGQNNAQTTRKRIKRPSRIGAPKQERKKGTVSFYSLANAPDPTNSPDPRSPASRADDDGVGAVESDEAI